MGKLTIMRVRSLHKPGRYGDGDTLFLHIAPGGSKSWVQRLVIRGRRRDLGLGGWPAMNLAKARDKAQENRRVARAGGDPREKKYRGAIPSFREAAERTFNLRHRGWRNRKHEKVWMQSLVKHAYPVFGDMRVDWIDRQDVLRVLTPIWTTRNETARRVRQRIRAVLSYCHAHSFVDQNVAGDGITGGLPTVSSKQRHHRSVGYEEIGDVLETLRTGRGSTATKLCLRFTILTAVRSGEARAASWEEIDEKARVWRIPGSRTKTAEELVQPLSEPALEVLAQARAIDDGSGYIFPSAQRRGQVISNMTMMKLLRDNGLAARMTVHGFRATFRTWASECTDADFAVMELSLGHYVGPKVVRAYDRAELVKKRRVLMEAWGGFATGRAQRDVG